MLLFDCPFLGGVGGKHVAIEVHGELVKQCVGEFLVREHPGIQTLIRRLVHVRSAWRLIQESSPTGGSPSNAPKILLKNDAAILEVPDEDGPAD